MTKNQQITQISKKELRDIRNGPSVNIIFIAPFVKDMQLTILFNKEITPTPSALQEMRPKHPKHKNRDRTSLLTWQNYGMVKEDVT